MVCYIPIGSTEDYGQSLYSPSFHWYENLKRYLKNINFNCILECGHIIPILVFMKCAHICLLVSIMCVIIKVWFCQHPPFGECWMSNKYLEFISEVRKGLGHVESNVI